MPPSTVNGPEKPKNSDSLFQSGNESDEGERRVRLLVMGSLLTCAASRLWNVGIPQSLAHDSTVPGRRSWILPGRCRWCGADGTS